MAGTVGAIFNGALQLGSAIGISAVGSIEASVNRTHGRASYAGRAAAFWFLLGIVGVEFVAMLVFYRISKEGTAEDVVVEQEKAKSLEQDVEAAAAERPVQLDEKGLELPRPDFVVEGERTPAVEQPQFIKDEVDYEEEHTEVTESPVRGDLNV